MSRIIPDLHNLVRFADFAGAGRGLIPPSALFPQHEGQNQTGGQPEKAKDHDEAGEAREDPLKAGERGGLSDETAGAALFRTKSKIREII